MILLFHDITLFQMITHYICLELSLNQTSAYMLWYYQIQTKDEFLVFRIQQRLIQHCVPSFTEWICFTPFSPWSYHTYHIHTLPSTRVRDKHDIITIILIVHHINFLLASKLSIIIIIEEETYLYRDTKLQSMVACYVNVFICG